MLRGCQIRPQIRLLLFPQIILLLLKADARIALTTCCMLRRQRWTAAGRSARATNTDTTNTTATNTDATNTDADATSPRIARVVVRIPETEILGVALTAPSSAML